MSRAKAKNENNDGKAGIVRMLAIRVGGGYAVMGKSHRSQQWDTNHSTGAGS